MYLHVATSVITETWRNSELCHYDASTSTYYWVPRRLKQQISFGIFDNFYDSLNTSVVLEPLWVQVRDVLNHLNGHMFSGALRKKWEIGGTSCNEVPQLGAWHLLY